MKSVAPLIPPSAAMHKQDVTIIDARGGKDALDRFLKGHVEGGLFVDLEQELSEKPTDPSQGGRHPLPEIKKFASLLGKLGITPFTHVLVYDDKAGANSAARFWWMMKAVGHEHIQVIDGGLDALVQEGVTLTTNIRLPRPVEKYPANEWKFVVDIETVSRAVGNPDYLIVDAREGYRFRGESEPIDLKAGHIPGAVNVPYVDNLNPDGSFRSAQELVEKYQTVIGRINPSNVIVHCGSGVTACHTLLAMEHAGIHGPKLYVGSWSEWSRRSMPVATNT